jgi:acetylornithine/N-succinyldiaminopimelate aminotransferase
MQPGSHGTTFGGNPLAMAVGNAVLDVMLAEGFLEDVERKSNHLRQQLNMLVEKHPTVLEEVRGQGLLLGVKCRKPNTDLIAAMREERMLGVGAGDNVVRLLPPLTIDERDIGEGIARLDAACGRLR